MNKYDVLSDLDLIVDEENAKNVDSWIAALSDGEYLSKFNYPEEAVNDAVGLLERLNECTQFIIFEAVSGYVYSCHNGFDSLMEKLAEIADNDTKLPNALNDKNAGHGSRFLLNYYYFVFYLLPVSRPRICQKSFFMFKNMSFIFVKSFFTCVN